MPLDQLQMRFFAFELSILLDLGTKFLKNIDAQDIQSNLRIDAKSDSLFLLSGELGRT
ncbi:hypothetical protein HY11_17465 [Hyphomonas pacifica]|nr:hypothetical protein HY11_17465 [Hyphomonas pacifica]